VSDLDSPLKPPSGDTVPAGSALARPRRLRRRLLWTAAILAILAAAASGLFVAWISSSEFEKLVRNRLIKEIQTATGGRVEMASFTWRPFDLEADANGLVLHGLEAPGEAPFAQIERLRVRLSLIGFWSPRILLRDVEIDRPQLHCIVYRDGSTNQPQPRRPRKPGRRPLDTFFDLKAGHIAVEEATVLYENRAVNFDYQGRMAPVSFQASDFSLLASYSPASGGNSEFYRIEAGARDLNLARRSSPNPAAKIGAHPQSVQGFVQATLDLTRSAAYLRSLRITARSRGVKDRSIEIAGNLQDFARPRWQARATGELEMSLLDPLAGYPETPEGVAHVDLTGAGQAGIFRADGGVHIDGGAYIANGVVARGIRLDARVHADPEQLLIGSIVARLEEGGQLEGEIALTHWLPPIPGSASIQAAASPAGKTRPGQPRQQVAAAPAPSPGDIVIPVDGKVTARFKGVALDTVLEMVAPQPFQHLGLDTRIDGPATAAWVKGDNRTLSVDAQLSLTPPAQAVAEKDISARQGGNPVAGKVPATGFVEGTYTQRDGAVDLRKLEVRLPASRVEAHGKLGAYPLTSSTAIAVDLRTANLGEFDTVLRDLGLVRNGKAGTAALPGSLAGQAEFHGSWSGSLLDPHLAGTAKATQLTLEIPAPPNGKPAPAAPDPPQFVHWDTAEATGSYSAQLVAIDRAQLRQGPATLVLDGSLQAMAGTLSHAASAPAGFDSDSILHLRLRAANVGLDKLLPFTGQSLPLAGTLGAQIAADGPLRALGGSGWIDLEGGTVYGEPVSSIRAQGTIAGRTVSLNSVTLAEDAERISATGSFDLKSRRFQMEAKGTGIELSHIQAVRRQGLEATGKLTFSLSGTGTLDDPHLEAQATLASLALGGEPMGELHLTAHSANRALVYDISSSLESAELVAHGQTALSGEHESQARIDFSRFNIGALLKMAHVQGLSGESALAGSVTLDGPLDRPERMRGDARLKELGVAVSGVHLHSDGGVHATLSDARLTLDPLHVTGEETDLRVQGSLSLKDNRQLDLAASGSINLKIAQSLDPDLTASGSSTFQVEAHGPLQNPGLRGRVDFQNGSLALEDLPNGLSQINGSLEFNRNRLEVKSLTAMSGGGLLSVNGFLSYRQGLFADLTVAGKGIRIRYPQGVSSLADASFHLQGQRDSLLLSGDVLITRFAVNPDFDFAGLASQANAVESVAPADAPSNHIRLDVHIASSPQLNFQNAFAKLAGNVDLHLRGTVASPALQGRVSITEGSAILAGTRYELQRGEISFTNPVRIEPNIDINATARVEDYDITLGLRGTPTKMAVSYRSDPPLPEADVVALLALGRTQNQQRIYTQQQLQSNPTTDALLGGALNATVSSRVQKLFGAGSVKVDPNYLGAMGNSTSRIIVEEQLGRNLTLTYATNVNSTAQQLLQAEVAINRHVSLLVARDESGVFSMVVKATRRYR
jgi:translocation and assembly module TamB